MKKRKSKEFNVGVEALRISEEQSISFREAWRIALDEKKILLRNEGKLA